MNQYEELINCLQEAYNLNDLKIVRPYHHLGHNYVLLHEFFGDRLPEAVFKLLFMSRQPYDFPLDFPHIYRSEVGIFVTFEVLAASLEVKDWLDNWQCSEPEKKIYTYVMYDESTDAYKIGQSVNPAYREKTLQAEKPTVKTILLSDKNVEHELHKCFSHKRIRGEWFRLDANDILFMIDNYQFNPL